MWFLREPDIRRCTRLPTQECAGDIPESVVAVPDVAMVNTQRMRSEVSMVVLDALPVDVRMPDALPSRFDASPFEKKDRGLTLPFSRPFLNPSSKSANRKHHRGLKNDDYWQSSYKKCGLVVKNFAAKKFSNSLPPLKLKCFDFTFTLLFKAENAIPLFDRFLRNLEEKSAKGRVA